MKDLSLSLLSRGCGRFVSSNRNTGRHDGRLDVCFTPEDYYIWKSQDSLLRLSNSGRLLAEAESTLPKTYSTRRGPLLLYSQDLVTKETGRHSETRDRKQRVVRRYTQQQVEQQLSTLKELTAAILSFSSSQLTSSRLGPPSFPSLRLPLAPDFHRPSPAQIRATREQPSPGLLVQLNPEWLPAERNAEQLENQPGDEEVEQGGRKRVRLDVFLQIPCTSRTPTPQMEPQPWIHYVAMTPEGPEEPQTHSDMSPQHAEINPHSVGGELRHPDTNDEGCSVQDGAMIGDKGNNEKSTCGDRRGGIVRLRGAEQQPNTESGTSTTSVHVDSHDALMPGSHTGLLPPLAKGHSVRHGPSWERKDRPGREVRSGDERRAQRLPPIAESRNVAPGWAIQAQTQQAFQSQENLNRLHQQHLFLPLLSPEMEEAISEQNLKKEAAGGGGGGRRLHSEKGSVILLEPGDGPPPPPVGVLGCVAGRKGPGKQSSLAFLQNRLLDLQDPCERGVVKGVLPLQLRDLQNDNSAGSLILGPDGEIIHLSLYDNSQDPSRGGGDPREQALQVLSAGGERLPWVILLQPDHTHAEGGVELNVGDPAGDVQHHQSMHKNFSSLFSDQLLDLRRSTEANACSPSSQHTDPAAVNKKKRKSAVAAAEASKGTRKGAANNVRMPPLRERVGREDLRGGNTEAEEEEEEEEEEDDEEEELGSTGQTDHSSGSHQPGQQNKATAEDNVDRRRKKTKTKDAEEAAITTGKRDTKTVKGEESSGKKTSRTRKEGRQKPGSDAQSVRSQKHEKSRREAAEARHHSALPSVKKKTAAGDGERGEVSMTDEERDEPGEVARQREESAGGRRRRRRRKRRGRMTLQESVDVWSPRPRTNLKSPQGRSDNAPAKKVWSKKEATLKFCQHREQHAERNHDDPLENDELEIDQGVEGESQPKSTNRPCATQRHSNTSATTSEEDTDADHLSTSADDYSSVQSVSSLRSAATAATSQFNQRGPRRSAASSCERTVPASAMGHSSSRGHLSSCSTVMVTEEQLMLNPVKPELSRPRKSQAVEEEEEAAALRLAQRAERRRQEADRKRRQREEEERKQQEKEQTEERMRGELDEERRKRAEELRLRRQAAEEERGRREEGERERARWEQEQRERERRRQEERRRQVERLQRMREEEEQRRKAELERLRLEEERRQEEESEMLQEMDEGERIEYLCRKEQQEEDRRIKEEERKRRDGEAAEEARLQEEQLAREMALLHRQLAFKRGLALEAGGLEKTQGISRPWIYSYFTLLQLLGLNPTTAEATSP